MSDPDAARPDASTATAADDRRDALRATTLVAALARHRVPAAGRDTLLVGDRPAAFRERLVARGAKVTVLATAELAARADAGAYELVLWLDAGLDPTVDAAWDGVLTRLAGVVVPGGWLALLAATPERGAPRPADAPSRAWEEWETALLARGLAVHDVRATRRFSGAGARVPGWLRPFPGLAWRLDYGLIATGLLLAGAGERLVLARRVVTQVREAG